jgi:hypothetical protein
LVISLESELIKDLLTNPSYQKTFELPVATLQLIIAMVVSPHNKDFVLEQTKKFDMFRILTSLISVPSSLNTPV